MSFDASLPQKMDEIVTIQTVWTNGEVKDFAGTVVSQSADLEITQTAEDGTPLPVNQFRLRVLDEVAGTYSAIVNEGDVTLAININKEAPVDVPSSFNISGVQVPRV